MSAPEPMTENSAVRFAEASGGGDGADVLVAPGLGHDELLAVLLDLHLGLEGVQLAQVGAGQAGERKKE